jgi:hypothetical protein
MNLDYHFEEQSVEAALYKQYPRHFKKPRSLQKAPVITKLIIIPGFTPGNFTARSKLNERCNCSEGIQEFILYHGARGIQNQQDF